MVISNVHGPTQRLQLKVSKVFKYSYTSGLIRTLTLDLGAALETSVSWAETLPNMRSTPKHYGYEPDPVLATENRLGFHMGGVQLPGIGSAKLRDSWLELQKMSSTTP